MKNQNIPENISENEIDNQFGDDLDVEDMPDDDIEDPDLTIDDMEVEELEEINQDKSYE